MGSSTIRCPRFVLDQFSAPTLYFMAAHVLGLWNNVAGVRSTRDSSDVSWALEVVRVGYFRETCFLTEVFFFRSSLFCSTFVGCVRYRILFFWILCLVISLGLFVHLPLSFRFHFGSATWNCGVVLVYSHRYPKYSRYSLHPLPSSIILEATGWHYHREREYLPWAGVEDWCDNQIVKMTLFFLDVSFFAWGKWCVNYFYTLSIEKTPQTCIDSLSLSRVVLWAAQPKLCAVHNAQSGPPYGAKIFAMLRCGLTGGAARLPLYRTLP